MKNHGPHPTSVFIRCALLLVGLAATASLRSGTVAVTMDDAVGGGVRAEGQYFGESGLESTVPWSGSIYPLVVDVDLASAGTSYGLVQSGPPRSVRTDVTNAEGRQVWRPLEAPLAGVVWGSFLVRVKEGNSRGGISFNQEAPAPLENRILIMGSAGETAAAGDKGELFVKLGGMAERRITNVVDYTRDALVLYRIDFAGGTMAVWVNPDVADLGAPQFTSSGLGQDPMSGAAWTEVNRIGIISYGDAGGNEVDMVHLSDGQDAYEDVTGVAPPVERRVRVTFNDAVGGGVKAEGQYFGESGLDAGVPWSGSVFPSVIDVDLAPAGTSYGLVQSGSARSVRNPNTNGLWRHVWRPLEAPLTGVVWGSFLVRVIEGRTRGGISFNHEGTDPEENKILVFGSAGETAAAGDRGELHVKLKGVVERTIPDVVDYTRDALVLYRIDFAGGTMAVWVNPDVAALKEPQFFNDGLGQDPMSGAAWTEVNRIGIVSYGDVGGNIVDMVHLSDGEDAYRDVTGVGALSPQGEILVEAESFFGVGAAGQWVIDQQFVESMGSPYLLAHGSGIPVSDAVKFVMFSSPGSYAVWVRTMDWVPDRPEAPGTFRVAIDGTELPVTFGTNPGWGWVSGGSVAIGGPVVEIRLVDGTGFDGRCDALFFTEDPDFVPPQDPEALRAWRRSLSGLPADPPLAGRYDLVVVGGGIAGCAAAVAAAREGLQVALIHDRPYLGGNASREIRVPAIGFAGFRIVNEINTRYFSPGSGSAIDFDVRRHGVVEGEENISLHLSTRAHHVNTSGRVITSIEVKHIATGEEKRFEAPLFIDCTGDGWIGYWAGARTMMGREGQADFGEALAPVAPDAMTLGTSLLWTSRDAGAPRAFPPVPWAMDIAKDRVETGGDWFWEYGFHLDTIDDAEMIRDHLLRAIYGTFSNAKGIPGNEELVLDFVAYIAGKRESRRLVGDYILTEADVRHSPGFADGVVQERREIDLHRPEPGPYDFISVGDLTPVDDYTIPFRCLYAADIDNLLMAGRCLSATHVGLGSPRIMNTCGQMGVAVGCAAALCKKYSTTPRGIYQHHVGELREIIGLIDLNDLPENTVAVLDNADPSGVQVIGGWTSSKALYGFYKEDYIHDDNKEKGEKSVLFTPDLPRTGTYGVHLVWTAELGRATNVPVTVIHAGGETTIRVDQSDLDHGSRWVLIGAFPFARGATGSVRISNEGTDGAVMADAVAFSLESWIDSFRRGDANGDGSLDVSDPIAILLHLFAGGQAVPCEKAADANDGGEIDVSDAIYALEFLFLDGAVIPEPSGACGEDPSPDELTCSRFEPCE